MSSERYELSDVQWNQIKDLFPEYRTGRPPKSNRMMFNAVLWIARSGAAWRDLPKERYGSWKTVYSRFCLWRDTGLLESLFIALNCEVDYENLSIDSTVVTAHQQSAVTKKGAEVCHFATHWKKQWRAYNKNLCHRRRIREFFIFPIIWRKSSR